MASRLLRLASKTAVFNVRPHRQAPFPTRPTRPAPLPFFCRLLCVGVGRVNLTLPLLSWLVKKKKTYLGRPRAQLVHP